MKFPNPFKRAETVSREQFDWAERKHREAIRQSQHIASVYLAERDAALAKIAHMQSGLSKGTAASAAKRRKAGA